MIETSGKPPTTHRSLSSPAHQALPAPDAPAGEGDEPGIAWSAGPTGVASSSPTPPIDENGDDDGADSEKTTNDGAGQDKEVAQVVVLEQEAQGARLIDRLRLGHLNQKERLSSASSPEVGKGAIAALTSPIDDASRRSSSQLAPPRLIKRAPTAPNPSSFHPAPGTVTSGAGTTTPFFLHDVERNADGTATPGGRRPIVETLMNPTKKLASDADLTWKRAGWNVISASWLNVLLIMIPVAWAMEFTHQADTIVFVFSALAIIPLASLLGFATEQLALRVGDTLGGLLNATFGNAVELLISILALVKGELDIVQASMIGSVLSNVLLVLGMCFFAGGLRFHEQGYAMRAAQLNISLLGTVVIAVGIPAAFHISNGRALSEPAEGLELTQILAISRGIAVLMLLLYVAYLLFMLYTHVHFYKSVTPTQRRRLEAAMPDAGPAPPGSHVFRLPDWVPSHFGSSSSSASASSGASVRSRRRGADDDQTHEDGSNPQDADVPDVVHVVGEPDEEEEEELEVPQLTTIQAFVILFFIVVLTGVTAEFLIGSIDGMTETGNISRTFTSLILLPLIGNAAEHVTAVTVSVKDKIDLSLTIAVGSSIQIALFVIPFLTLLAWAIGQPLSLLFTAWETILLVLTVLLVNWVLNDGRANWIEGVILMMTYISLALASWFA